MAVRFSASGQSYSRTTAYPTMPFTILQWVYMVTDRNAVSGLWGVTGNFTPNGLMSDADGTTFRLKSGTVNSIGPAAITAGAWYRIAVVCSGSTGTIYYGTGSAALSTVSGTFSNPSLPNTFRIGSSDTSTEFFNGRIAPHKEWAAALTLAELNQEFSCVMPCRTANLTAWYPWVNAGTVDYSGNARTLSGGAGATTESGPPIPWRIQGASELLVPPDPAAVPWYVVYITSTGELFSIGDVYELQPDQSVKTYYGPPVDLRAYEWSTTALDFVTRAGYDLIDRVADLLADSTLTSAWAALSAPQSAAMQDRIGQMLGPYRYRDSAQSVDL